MVDLWWVDVVLTFWWGPVYTNPLPPVLYLQPSDCPVYPLHCWT